MAQSETVLASGNFLVPNATFIAELVAFLIILGVLAKYVRARRSRRPMAARQEMIASQVEDTEQAKEKLAEAEAEYQRRAERGTRRGRRDPRERARRGAAHRRGTAGPGPGGVGAHRRPRRGAAGQPARRDRARAARPRSARWRSSCPRRSSTSGSPTTRRSERPSTRSWPTSNSVTRRARSCMMRLPQAGARLRHFAARHRQLLDAHRDRRTACSTWPTSCTRCADLLTSQPRLRRALADPATRAGRRARLGAGRVFGPRQRRRRHGRPGDRLASAGRIPWDLTDALERRRRRCALRRRRTEPATLDEVEDELFRFERILDAQAELDDAARRGAGPIPSVGRACCATSSGGKVHPVTQSLLDARRRAASASATSAWPSTTCWTRRPRAANRRWRASCPAAELTARSRSTPRPRR